MAQRNFRKWLFRQVRICCHALRGGALGVMYVDGVLLMPFIPVQDQVAP